MVWTTEDIKEKAEKDIKQIVSYLDGFDLSDIQTNGFSVRCGSKVLKMTVVGEDSLDGLVNEIKEEYKSKMRDKIDIIKKNISKKINEMSDFVYSIKTEYLKKEKTLNDRLNNTSMMPDITFEHAKKGLSIIKGDGKNSLYWLVRGVYWPRFVDGIQIDPSYSKKMMSPIIFLFQTNGDRITGISTRKEIGLDYFDHYHQNKPDCWGSWKYNVEWKSPWDIIKVAEQAQAVLENINTMSIVRRSPLALPRIQTVQRHLLGRKDDLKDGSKLNQTDVRLGLKKDTLSDSDNVWSSIDVVS